jgi:hypothetical protein
MGAEPCSHPAGGEMTLLLSDFARNEHTQFGEDGMIAHIFDTIGEDSRHCVEFGANDGISCSNTKCLRDAGWSALLIEADDQLYDQIVPEHEGVRRLHASVSADNINTLLKDEGVIDFLSIDVDGDDYLIFDAMETRPRVVCVEYNSSIPPHISVHPGRAGGKLGASALALVNVAKRKGYELVGLNVGNLFFVNNADLGGFQNYVRDLNQLFDPTWLTYLASDYRSRAFVVGAAPHWGLTSDVLEVTDSDLLNFQWPYELCLVPNGVLAFILKDDYFASRPELSEPQSQYLSPLRPNL